MNVESILAGIDLMKSLYREELNKKKQSISILFDEKVAIKEQERINGKVSATETLLAKYKKYIGGDLEVKFTSKDKVDFKVVLSYCLNYLSSLEKVYPIFSNNVGRDPESEDYDLQLKKQQELIFSIYKVMQQHKIV